MIETMGPVLDNMLAIIQGKFAQIRRRELGWMFGYRIHPVHKTPQFHSGADFGAPIGSSVYTPYSGTVVAAWNDTKWGGGNSLVINHSGVDLVQTGYAHLSKFLVRVGDKVVKSDEIAKSGNTGIGTGPHLHFTCRAMKNSVATLVDPFPLLVAVVGLKMLDSMPIMLLPGMSLAGAAYLSSFTASDLDATRRGTVPSTNESSGMGAVIDALNAGRIAAETRAVAFSLLVRRDLNAMNDVQNKSSENQLAATQSTRTGLMASPVSIEAQKYSDAVLFNPITGLYGDGTAS